MYLHLVSPKLPPQFIPFIFPVFRPKGCRHKAGIGLEHFFRHGIYGSSFLVDRLFHKKSVDFDFFEYAEEE
jgi:hypothetical protein